MTGFLGKLFGKKKKEETTSSSSGPESMVEDVLGQILELGRFELTYELRRIDDETLQVELEGADEELLTAKEGQLLDALQLYVRRAVQHQMPDSTLVVNLDCAGFREAANEALIQLAEKLKDIALTKGKSVYFRALPPKDRKVIHQYLAEDGRVKSRSIGDGHFKKIKIYPVKEDGGLGEERDTLDEAFGNR